MTSHDKPWPRALVHLDMDAFYASVEQRDTPALRGKPVLVGGAGQRSVVTSPSYEARRFGVRSAMPMAVARKLCPQAILVAPRMARYAEVSRGVRAILERFSPQIEPLSLDEAFLDITGTHQLLGPPVDVAWKLQRAVREELQLSCSVGVAGTKVAAKVASDLKKPGGLVVVLPGEERAFLEPLPVERLWGVGPKTAEILHALGLVTIGQLADASVSLLEEKLGTAGPALVAMAEGKDERPVEGDKPRKSLGAERTLDLDVAGVDRVRAALVPLVDEVAAGLRARRVRAGGVRLKVKYADFRTASREAALSEPAQDATSLRVALDALVQRVDTKRAIRLVGVTAVDLVDENAPRQASLFGHTGEAPVEKAERLGHALDRIQARFPDAAVRRASTPRGEDEA